MVLGGRKSSLISRKKGNNINETKYRHMITMRGLETTDEYGQKCWFLPNDRKRCRGLQILNYMI